MHAAPAPLVSPAPVYKYTADLGTPTIVGGEDLFDYQYLQCKGIALIKTMCVVANICNSCIV